MGAVGAVGQGRRAAKAKVRATTRRDLQGEGDGRRDLQGEGDECSGAEARTTTSGRICRAMSDRLRGGCSGARDLQDEGDGRLLLGNLGEGDEGRQNPQGKGDGRRMLGSLGAGSWI